VLRGGSWLDNPRFLRSADRDGGVADFQIEVVE
jgi:formylglycine-generating enzyme required for sulfatase activity